MAILLLSRDQDETYRRISQHAITTEQQRNRVSLFFVTWRQLEHDTNERLNLFKKLKFLPGLTILSIPLLKQHGVIPSHARLPPIRISEQSSWRSPLVGHCHLLGIRWESVFLSTT